MGFLLENLGPLLFGLILAVYGLYILRKVYIYIPTKALCIDVAEEEIYGNAFLRDGKSGTYKFVFNGSYKTIKENNFLCSRRLKAGREYKIYVNPNNSEEIVSEFGRNYGIIFVVSGLSVFVYSLFFLW